MTIRWLSIAVTAMLLSAPTACWAQTVDLWYLSFHGGDTSGSLNNLVSFDATGTLLSQTVLDDSHEKLSELRGFVVLPDGNLYVANAFKEDSKIVAFGPASSPAAPRPLSSKFLKCDAKSNPGLQHPFEPVIGPDQLFYVANQGDSKTTTTTNAVTRYIGHGPKGTPGPIADVLAGTGSFYPGTFVAPADFPDVTTSTNGVQTLRGLVFGPDGDLYVADEGVPGAQSQSVRQYRGPTASCVVHGTCAEGAFVQNVVTNGLGLGSPGHVTLSPDTTQLYVSDETNNQVLRYTFPVPPITLGAVDVAVPSTACPSARKGEIDAPAGLAFGKDGALYVVTRKGQQVLRITNYQTGSTAPLQCGVFIDLPSSGIGDNPEFIKLVTVPQGGGGDSSGSDRRGGSVASTGSPLPRRGESSSKDECDR